MENGIYYDGKFLAMEYEELCDLFACYRNVYNGNSISLVRDIRHNNLTIEKVSNVFGTLLPMTDY